MPDVVEATAAPLGTWWALDIEAVPTNDEGLRDAYLAERIDRLDLDAEVIIWRRAMNWPQPEAGKSEYQYDIKWQRREALELWLNRELTLNIHTATVGCACAQNINRFDKDAPFQLRTPADTLTFVQECIQAGDGFVTHNGSRYDLPLLLSTAMRCDAAEARDLIYALMHGDRRDQHVDMSAEIKRAMVRPITLDLALRRYCGVDGKTSTGRKFFATATVGQLMEHCVEDIGNTVLLARRFQWLIQNERLRDLLALLPSS